MRLPLYQRTFHFLDKDALTDAMQLSYTIKDPGNPLFLEHRLYVHVRTVTGAAKLAALFVTEGIPFEVGPYSGEGEDE
jgi:hypothetical protein